MPLSPASVRGRRRREYGGTRGFDIALFQPCVITSSTALDERAPRPPDSQPTGREACARAIRGPSARLTTDASSCPAYRGRSSRLKTRATRGATLAAAEASNGASAISRHGAARGSSSPRAVGKRSISVRRHQVGDQRRPAPRQRLDPHDADAAHLDQAGDRRRRAHDNDRSPHARSSPGRRRRGERRRRSAAAPDRICRHRTARAAAPPRPSIATAVRVHQNELSAHVTSRRRQADRRSGRRSWRRSASLRFSAQIRPRCASTICFEIDSPSPECVPNFSPAGARCRNGRRSRSACPRGCRAPRPRR